MKRMLMELIGTFFLTLSIALTGNPIAIGIMLMSMIYIGRRVSGGHYNPAVTLTMLLEKRLSPELSVRYILAQCLGAAVGLSFFSWFTGNMFVPETIPGTPLFIAFAMEALYTMVFCWVILSVASDESHKGIVIGLTLMGIAFVGGIFNPAVAVGSMVDNMIKRSIMADMPTILVYVLAPFGGSLLASYGWNYFKE